MIAMAKLTDQIIHGRRVVRVETEDEFFHCLGHPMECPPGMAERFGYTDEVSPEQLAADLKGEREWEELQAQWAAEERLVEVEPDPSSPFHERGDRPVAAVIPFPSPR